MPLTTTNQETRKIIGGVQCVSRRYPSFGCPHKEGSEMLLAFERPDGKMQPYARARVMAIATMPMGTRMQDGRLATSLANGEGFATPEAWRSHFYSIYGALSDETEVTRLQLSIKLLDGANAAPQQDSHSEDDVPNVQKVQVELPKGQSRTVGSVDSLDDVAELESQMFGG